MSTTYGLLNYRRAGSGRLRQVFFENNFRRVRDDIADEFSLLFENPVRGGVVDEPLLTHLPHGLVALGDVGREAEVGHRAAVAPRHRRRGRPGQFGRVGAPKAGARAPRPRVQAPEGADDGPESRASL